MGLGGEEHDSLGKPFQKEIKFCNLKLVTHAES